MAKGTSTIKGENRVRTVTVTIALNNKNKPAESAGILASLTNDVNDALRKHFCAHQLKVSRYAEAKIPHRLRVRHTKKVIQQLERALRGRVKVSPVALK